MTQTTFRTSLLSVLAVLALAACSGGADTSPTDTPEPASVSQPLSVPPPASAASATTADDGKHCDGHGRDPAAFLKRFDKNGDGKLEVSELPDRMQAFLGKADTNGDGVITADEITASRAAMAKAHFAEKDKNGDGALTADEVGPRKWEHLKVADTDNNGSVTLAEIDQAIASGTLPMMMGHGFHHHGHHGHRADPGNDDPVQPQKS